MTPNSTTKFQKIQEVAQNREHKEPMFDGFTILASPEKNTFPVLPLNS